jgi:hypothetical protein
MAKLKQPKEKKILSREEQIQDALDRRKNEYYTSEYRPDALSVIPTVPTNRLLNIGDAVEIGNLNDCVVVGFTPDQKLVVVEYTSVENNYGKPIITPGRIGCWPWYSVFSLKETASINTINDDPCIINHFTSRQIDGLLNMAMHFGLNDNPFYQRGYVWTAQDEENLIRSVFDGADIGKFVFIKDEWPKRDAEVLDGKQRLNTLIRFCTSQFPYNGIYWHQLSRLDRYRFGDRTVQIAELDGRKYTEADKLRIFLRVNAAGVPQSDEHLVKIQDRLVQLESKS